MLGRILVLAALGMAAPITAMAARVQDFVIAGSDGYGTQECLASQSSCGRIVADAWCEAKGFRGALSYRRAAGDEITGSLVSSQAPKPLDTFVITCRD